MEQISFVQLGIPVQGSLKDKVYHNNPHRGRTSRKEHTRSDNKVHKLTTVCLLWQQWTETSVWFDDVGIPSLLFGSTEKAV
jgi:hypothetical protein